MTNARSKPVQEDPLGWRPLAASEFERLTRFVRILLEWDGRRRRMDAAPPVTEEANGDDHSGSLEPSGVVRAGVDQGEEGQTVLSNCAFDCGSLVPTYSKPFDLLVRGNETGCWRGRRDSNPRPPA